jgi:hypothetical protein
MQLFRAVFNDYRKEILSHYLADRWLLQNNVVIDPADSVRPDPALDNYRDAMINLSTIYRRALDIHDRVEDEIKLMPAKTRESERDSRTELIYPDVCFLHLYRLFREIITDTEDINKLSEYINKLEVELKIQSPQTNISEGINNALGGAGGLGSLINKVVSAVGGKGESLPAGGDLGNFGEFFNSVIENPTTKNMLGNVVNDLQDCKDLPTILQKLMSNLSDPQVTQSLVNTVAPTAMNTINSAIKDNNVGQSKTVVEDEIIYES